MNNSTFNIGDMVAEPLTKPVLGTKIVNTIELAAAEIVDGMVTNGVYESSRGDQYYDVALLLKPKTKKVTKKTTESGESETGEDTDAADAAEDNEDEGDDNAENENNENGEEDTVSNVDPDYQYFGVGRVKDPETNKFVKVEGTFDKKKMFSVNAQAKQILQGLLAAYIKELYDYYSDKSNSFPAKPEDAISGLKEFSLTNSAVSFAPFVITSAELYDSLGLEISNEETKGAGALQKALNTECGKLFTNPKGGKPITAMLEEFVCIYIKFLKLFTKYFTNHCWENKMTLNSGVVLGTFRNLSMILNANGGSLSENGYEVLTLYIEYTTTKHKKAPSKGAGAAKKAPGKGKGRGKGAGAGTKKAAGKASGKGKGRGRAAADEQPANVDDIGDDVETAAEEWTTDF